MCKLVLLALLWSNGDNLGRITQDIQDYTNGTPTAETNKTTDYTRWLSRCPKSNRAARRPLPGQCGEC